MKKKVSLLLTGILILLVTMGLAEETYTGQAQGFGGLVTVTLKMEDGRITDATIEGNEETPGIGGLAVEQMGAMLVEANSSEIDGIAGATYTSDAIRAAAAQALASAKGEVVAEVHMKPGVYTGEAWGYSDAVKVKLQVTVDETSIIAIDGEQPQGETPEVSFTAFDRLIPRMIEAQSVAVDAITGATLTSRGIKGATEEALKQALAEGGSDEAAIAHFYSVPEKSTETVTMDYDVVVVGMGAAGLSSAMSAAETAKELGKDVKILAIDKAGRFGGTSGMTSEPSGVNPPKFQDAYNDGKPYNDVAAVKKDWMEYTHGDCKEEMLDVYLNESGNTIDWLHFDHGFKFAQPEGGLDDTYSHRLRFTIWGTYDEISFNDRWGIIRTYFEKMVDDFKALGGEVMLETEGYELIYDKENRKIKGLKARKYDGTEYVINSDAVILCTGGYMNNPEMMDRYMSNEYYPLRGVWPGDFTWSINDGKMIQAAFDIGADSYNKGVPPMTHVGGVAQKIHDFPVYPNEEGYFSFTGFYTLNDVPNELTTGDPQTMAVDTKGKRFTSEDKLLTFNPWIAGPNFYCIWSDKQIKDIEANGFKFANLVPGVGSSGWPAGKPVEGIYDVLDVCIEKGFAWKGDTIQDLARAIGLPAEQLSKTLAEYNEMCKSGEDTAFGKPAEYLWELGDEGPYYCVKGASYAYGTCGALDVNEDINVLNWDNEVMNGLYACGLDSMGVLLTEKEAYVTFGGCAQGWAWTSGRLAGRNAVRYVTQE